MLLRRDLFPPQKNKKEITEMNYTVSENGKTLTTYSCTVFPKPYNSVSTMEYVMFSVKTHTELVIESEIEVHDAVIRPKSAGVAANIKNGKIYISVDKPIKISVEINGSCENNLLIFAHADAYEMPHGAEHIIAVKKGMEQKGTLSVCENNTVIYLEEGAAINGNIRAEGCENLTICGLGRVCMEQYTYEMRKDYARSVDIINCRNVVIDGIIIDDSNDWSLRINGCDNVNIKNVKIFGCRGNSDGIDVCGSRNVTVSDIFTRVWDDSFVVKALGTGNAENIVFKDSVLWNDFARPIEVGVELRADSVKNIRFENIDIIHSATGYPVMGIHHGDHARVSDIVFKNIRIEDAPGAQLFDIRIADSVWNRDKAMGDIRNITFSDIEYLGTNDNGVLLSNSRIEGFCEEHDIKNVHFHNIAIKGRAAQTAGQIGLDVYDFVSGISVTSDLNLPKAERLHCGIKEKKRFSLGNDGIYHGSVEVCLKNNTDTKMRGTAVLAVSPKNTAQEKEFVYSLSSGEYIVYEAEMELQPGKYVFFIKSESGEIENKFLYKELEAAVCCGKSIESCPLYEFVNYYNDRIAAVRIGADSENLIIMNECKKDTDFVLYTANPAEVQEGEVLFSAEETDFGEVCAYISKKNNPVPAPQLRCPAEITYVFKNEPKVGEILQTNVHLKSGETAKIPFEALGISKNADSFLLEAAAKMNELSELRYPYTLFHSTMPDKTAHMFGKFIIVK